MDPRTLQKKKHIALFWTAIMGVVLIGVFIWIRVPSTQENAAKAPDSRFRELYTTLIDTTQQYFSRQE